MTDLVDVVIDFETYYDAEYSLTKLTTIEYVLDPRFEVIGYSVSVGGAPAEWHTGTHLMLLSDLLQIDWSRARLVAHNAMFDGAILEWRFGINPAAYFCTMMASRPYVAPYTGSQSLASVAEYLGAGHKGNEVENHRGRRRESFTDQQLDAYGKYCCNDADLTGVVQRHLCNWLPDDEQYLISLTLLKFVRPSFVLDQTAIVDGIEDLQEARSTMLLRLTDMGYTPEEMRSRVKFAQILKAKGVDPPTKKSKATQGETFAFSKTDDDFMGLLTHANQDVRDLVEIKLALASNIEVTRFARFKKIYELNLGGEHRLPVPLLYYAAHPGRFGGTDSLNLQNLPRPDKDNPKKGALRRSMKAPPGYVVMAADYAAIEARITATLAGQWDLVASFLKGDDIYSQFASRIYGRKITKANDPVERFVGKMCILGLGYGMGWQRFLEVMLTAKVKMDEEQARMIVRLYRDTYPAIPNLWTSLERELRGAVNPKTMKKWGPLLFAWERITLPNSMPIIYPGLSLAGAKTGGLSFISKRKGSSPHEVSLWGGAITENVVQALARILATRAEIRLARAGLPAAHQAHDELVWVVQESWVDRLKPAIEKVMTDPVEWLPRLPIAVEIHHGKTYGDCK
jgi:DNA polymerase I-like protein with 3'-5' exonuclease and polymerase domains